MTFSCTLQEQTGGVRILACGKPSLSQARYGGVYDFLSSESVQTCMKRRIKTCVYFPFTFVYTVYALYLLAEGNPNLF